MDRFTDSEGVDALAAEISLQISFMGVIANLTREKETTLRVRIGATLRQVLDALEAKYGEEFGRRVFRTSDQFRALQTHTRIFVDGNLIDDSALDHPLPLPQQPSNALSPEVLIYLMPASCGG